MDLGLQGKVALVLAASKGLGRASASALAHEGAAVTIGARHKDVLEKTAQEIQKSSGSRVLAVPCDVTRPEDLEAIVTATVQEFGHLDILVNNAGGPPPGYFEHFDDSAWQKAFELNLLSAVRLIRLALPHMRQAGGGRIINIVSTSVKHSTAWLSSWSQAFSMNDEQEDARAELERLAAPLIAIGQLLPTMLQLFSNESSLILK